jgi:surface polysaccharide O-acyltransferase-like enzyme
MISGFLFFGRRAPTLKNFLRLLTCLAFYSSVALLFRIFFMGQSTESFDALLEAPVRPVFYHLWFFYPLFSVYLAAMFVQLRAPVSKVQIIALGLALFVLNPTSGDLRILGTGHDASDFAFFGFYSGSSVYFIFYGLTGAAIGALKDIERPRLLKISLWLLYAFVASTLAYLTDLSTLKMGEFDGKYMAPQNVLVAGVAVPLFLLFRFSSVKSSWFYAGLRFVSQHSLAIYGLHALVLFAIDSRGFRRFNQPLLDIPLTWLTVVAISLVLAAALRLVDRRRLFT